MEAAAARAARAETALSEALEAVEDLEARCASAQARELEAKRGAQARIDELIGQLEEADGNGAKVSNGRRSQTSTKMAVFVNLFLHRPT